MAAARMYPEEPRERATRWAVEGPAGRAGAIKRTTGRPDVQHVLTGGGH
ncbi:MAG TPA: hypothetical protein VN520_02800 [Streptomyces sp.]|nr:hypothetical protein [Streptomyces sp.]HWU05326.1 hypothetical protein [Streptomyces sp.]